MVMIDAREKREDEEEAGSRDDVLLSWGVILKSEGSHP